MSLNNPFAGPDYVRSLCNAIENIPATYPPQTGGEVTSLRFPVHLLAYFEAIGAASGWNRNQVVNALLNKGLFAMFAHLNDEQAQKIIDEVVNHVVPTHEDA